VSAGYRNLGPCRPAQPVSVLAFHGTRDAIVPYAGFKRFMGTWARREGCTPRPESTRARFAARFAWRGCRDSRVELVRVEGDTHGWPALEGANERIIAFVG
jgi:polyhydroxybutyrate depolymerase